MLCHFSSHRLAQWSSFHHSLVVPDSSFLSKTWQGFCIPSWEAHCGLPEGLFCIFYFLFSFTPTNICAPIFFADSMKCTLKNIWYLFYSFYHVTLCLGRGVLVSCWFELWWGKLVTIMSRQKFGFCNSTYFLFLFFIFNILWVEQASRNMLMPSTPLHPIYLLLGQRGTPSMSFLLSWTSRSNHASQPIHLELLMTFSRLTNTV